MNLSMIASQYTAAVNPKTPVQIQISTGSTINADGTLSPTYCDPLFARGDVQPLSAGEVQKADSLNIQGVRWKIYLSGEIDGLVRAEGKGGDLITILHGPHKGVWLVAIIFEQYHGWCSAGITLQNNS